MGNLTEARKKQKQSYRGEKTKDPEYKPDKNDETDDECQSDDEAEKNCKKQIVAEKKIIELFEICRHEGCGARVLVDDIQVVYHGQYMRVTQHCASCKNEDFVWETNKLVKGRLSETSLDLIIESQCNGLGTSQMVDFMDGINTRNLSRRTWNMVEQTYLYPSIIEVYRHTENKNRKKCVKKHKGEKITLAGDGRYDSAGFSSFYCLYLVLCCMTNKVLGFQLETKQPGKGSASMEPVAAKKVLGELVTENMRIGMFVSDRCTNIAKVITEIEEKSNTSITLEYDVWHLVKSLLKEIRHVTELQPWMETIKNFLWFSFNKAEGNYERLLEYLRAIPNHLVGVHSFPENRYLKRCPHSSDYSPEDKMFLKPNSRGVNRLNNILSNERMLEALKKATHFKHTGLVEMVNSLVTKYAPKRNFYGHRAMTAKVCCALLSHNENINRDIIMGEDGTPKLEIKKQRHGPPRGRVVRVPSTRFWIYWVKKRCMKQVKNGNASPIEGITEEKRMETQKLKDEIYAKHQSRYARQTEVEKEKQDFEEETDNDEDDVLNCFNSSDVYYTGEGEDDFSQDLSSDEDYFF